MTQVLIILENDVINNSFYLGKSGDFANIDYFLRHNYEVFVCNANDLQNSAQELPVFLVKNYDYTDNYYEAILNECRNITNKKTPAFGMTEEMSIKLEYQGAEFSEIQNGALLFSRAMPQSLTAIFLKNFRTLQTKFQTIQNMEEIVLYKDKVIPFLLQNNEEYIADFARIYTPDILNFRNQIAKNGYQKLAIDSIVMDLDDDFELNLQKIQQFRKNQICIKPFNLFGGIGVGIFQNIQKNEIQKHFETIKGKFKEFNVTEKHLVLVQKAVKHPDFGDIRAIFSKGEFLGAFKRYEPKHWIHNTMNGAIIVPVCNKNLEFFSSFESKYHAAFKLAIAMISNLNNCVDFLKNEIFYGCDLLLDETQEGFEFKLTEINIACPTGFAFLDSSLLYNSHIDLNTNNVKEYFEKNGRVIDWCFHGVAK
jgi:hypothetical protein